MENVKEPTVNLPSDESKQRTPAYANFDSSTDKLLHLMTFILRGLQDFREELETKLGPEVMRIATEIAQRDRLQGKEATNQETETGTPHTEQDLSNARKSDRVQRISDTLLKPMKQFTEGFLTVREWIPVLLVTTVETYLEDVLIYAAKVDPAIMESSRPTVPYVEVIRARSLEELKTILPPRWARNNFVNDGGPDSWIKKLTKMGARGYRPETANEMETLWGVRHLIVHSRSVATPAFARQHPEIRIKVGENISIRSDQLTAWVKVVYHFVDVTDFYFVQRTAAAEFHPH